ncbi:DUF5687 family protein [Rubricoccus marinus]|uniref:ABC-2 type transport system permease protein n=1 Tax=Rubricoccus marinus TaxID=716817 RepID=A0A259TVS7_9BACT|nr:DUF5687 family protein [Rubricoccus marinus]OZC01843.1 hypothetical protein BSZ36_01865 [Rubricoccus marinus]
MFLSLLRLQSLAFWRAPYLGGRIALALVKGAGALYAIASALIIGFVWPDLVGVVSPEADAVGLVETWFLPALAVLMGVRFVFQEVPTRGATAFLLLPVSRRRVASGVLARSLPTPLNLAPLAFMLPFAVRAVQMASGGPDSASAAGAAWGVGVAAVLLVALSHFLFVVWKTQSGARPLATVLGVAGTVGAVALLDLAAGGLLASVRAGALWPLAVLGVLLAAIGAAAYRGLVASLYLDHRSQRKRKKASGASGFARGGVRDWLDLNGVLLRRTTFPRGIAVNAVLVSLGLTVLVLIPDSGGFTGGLFTSSLVLVFSTGALAGSLGQYALPFASGYFDRLLTLPGGIERFVRAAAGTVVLGTLGIGALQVIPVLILAPGSVWLIGVSILFSLGVLAPSALWGSTLGPKPVDVSERLAFNYKAQSFGAQFAVGGTAVLVGGLLALAGPTWGPAVAALLGTAGIALAPLWLRALARRIRRQRHVISARFRGAL